MCLYDAEMLALQSRFQSLTPRWTTSEEVRMSSDFNTSSSQIGYVQSGIYGDDDAVRSEFLAYVSAAIADRDTVILRQDFARLHESEVGDVLEALRPEQRTSLIELLGETFDYAALTEVDDAIREELIEALPNDAIARGMQDLDSDDAVYILEDLDDEDRDQILAQLPFADRTMLRRALDYPEDSAGRRMQSEFVAVPAFWSVGQTIDYMREDKDLPDSFSQVFVVEPTFKLIGAVDLDRILRAKRGEKIKDIMHETRHAIPAAMDQEEASQIFQQYDLLSAAVVDDGGRLVGVLTIDNVVDVIHEEAEEDIMRLGGVGDEELSNSVLQTIKSRMPAH
jgi:magnesium transporter